MFSVHYVPSFVEISSSLCDMNITKVELGYRNLSEHNLKNNTDVRKVFRVVINEILHYLATHCNE